MLQFPIFQMQLIKKIIYFLFVLLVLLVHNLEAVNLLLVVLLKLSIIFNQAIMLDSLLLEKFFDLVQFWGFYLAYLIDFIELL